MCPGGAPVAGEVRRWRPEACTCGPDVPCSGAKCRSAPQMILNKAARGERQAGESKPGKYKNRPDGCPVGF